MALMVGVAAWIAPSAAAAQWTQLGGSLNTATRSADAVTRLDASGAPIVAWVESGGNGTGKLFVARWTGNAWSRFGSSLNTSDPTLGRGALQLDAGGMPVVAWAEGTTGIVARWDGAQWQRLGSFANVMNALVSVVSANPLLVAHFDTNRQLALESWTGSALVTGGDARPPWLQRVVPAVVRGSTAPAVPSSPGRGSGRAVARRTGIWSRNVGIRACGRGSEECST